MKQVALNLNLSVKKTRKQMFLEQMEQVVPWADLAFTQDAQNAVLIGGPGTGNPLGHRTPLVNIESAPTVNLSNRSE